MRALGPLFIVWALVEVIGGPLVIRFVTVPALHALAQALGTR